MRILLVGAMDVEIQYIREYFKENNEEIKEEIHNDYHFYLSKIGKHEIILVKSGIGRVKSAILMTTAIIYYKFDKVINIGLAGGLKGTKTFDIVVGVNSVYGDVNVSSFENGYAYGQMSGCPPFFGGDEDVINAIKEDDKDYIHYGGICSCDKFTTSSKETEYLINNYFSNLNILAFDMESAAFAQCCYIFNIPFLAIRNISDIIGADNQEAEYANNESAVNLFDRNNKFVVDLIKRIK